jgi:hypothetical protein
MLVEVCLKVNYEGITEFKFQFEKKRWITIELFDCGTYGDNNYKRFGVVSGAYIQNYYIFKLKDTNQEKFLLVEEEFWSRDVDDYEFEFEFSDCKITCKANLCDFDFFILSKEQLNEWYEYIDSI